MRMKGEHYIQISAYLFIKNESYFIRVLKYEFPFDVKAGIMKNPVSLQKRGFLNQSVINSVLY